MITLKCACGQVTVVVFEVGGSVSMSKRVSGWVEKGVSEERCRSMKFNTGFTGGKWEFAHFRIDYSFLNDRLCLNIYT